MRLLINCLIVLMLATAGYGLLHHHDQKKKQDNQELEVRRALWTLQEQAFLRGAMAQVETTDAGFPLRMKRSWFTIPPENLLAESAWIDEADPNSTDEHPADPVLDRCEQAGFWYNPYRGIFRARVPRQFTDWETLLLYKRINGAPLETLPDTPQTASPQTAPEPASTVIPTDFQWTQPAPAPAKPTTSPQVEPTVQTPQRPSLRDLSTGKEHQSDTR